MIEACQGCAHATLILHQFYCGPAGGRNDNDVDVCPIGHAEQRPKQPATPPGTIAAVPEAERIVVTRCCGQCR